MATKKKKVWKFLRAGDRFKNVRSRLVYLLAVIRCQEHVEEVVLICMQTGNRFYMPYWVRDSKTITEKEWEMVTDGMAHIFKHLPRKGE